MAMPGQVPKSPERTKEKAGLSPEETSTTLFETDLKGLDVSSHARVRQHSMWDTEFATIGKKEAEHMSAQRKLIRQELGTFAGDLAAQQLALEETKRSMQQAITKINAQIAEQQGRLEEEHGLRVAMEELFKGELQKLRSDLNEESSQREIGDRRTDADLTVKLRVTEQAVVDKCKDLPMMKDKLGGLQPTVTRLQQQLDSLREDINQEGRSREAGDDQVMRHLRDHKDAVPKLIQDAVRDSRPHKQEIAELKDSIEREKIDRHSVVSPLHEKVHSAHRDISQHKEDLGALRRVCEELENSILQRVDAQQHDIEKLGRNEKADRQAVDSRITELATKLDRETAVLSEFMSEVEQALAPLKAKLRTLEQEQKDAARQVKDDLEASLREKVTGEAEVREAQIRTLQGQLSGHKAVLDTRLEAMHTGHKELEQKLREAPAKGVVDPTQLRKTEELAKQVQRLEGRLPEEQPARGTVMYPHEDQINYLEQFLKDTCERFVDGLQRRKNSLKPRTMVVEYPDVAEEKATPRNLKPVPPTSPLHAEKAPESISQRELELQPPPSATQRAAPVVGTEKEGQLKKVLASNRVKLVMNEEPVDGVERSAEEAFEAQLHLEEPIEFVAVHHGDTTEAQFTNEAKAKEVLSDVAEVLRVYHGSSLLIEGHTATPPERMDKWAHELAHRRAEKVKATIVGFGVDGNRLGTVGLPGHLGSGKHDTVLKITSF